MSDGIKALGDHRYASAVKSLESAISVSGRQDFGNTPYEARDRLADAKAAIAAADEAKRHEQAVQLLNEAKASGTNDLVTSVHKLRQAREIDQSVGGADLLASWEAQARSEGEASLQRARTYDNYPSRSADALSQYQRAVTLLDLVPGGHPGVAEARARIEQLKSGR